jgi:Protein of unknown function (DUF745)
MNRDQSAKKAHEDANQIHSSGDDTKGCGDCGEHQEESGGLDWLQKLIKRHHTGEESPMHGDDRKVDEKSKDVGDSSGGKNSIDDESRGYYETDDHGAVASSTDSAVFKTAEACKNGASNCKSRVNSAGNARERAARLMDSTSGSSEQTSSTQEAQAARNTRASKHAMSQLAENAVQAARAAEQAVAMELESELRLAQKVVQFLSSGLTQSEESANVAMRAAQQATELLKALTEAAQTAQSNLKYSEQAAQGVVREIAAKRQLLAAAKNRVEQLLRELKTTTADYAA